MPPVRAGCSPACDPQTEVHEHGCHNGLPEPADRLCVAEVLRSTRFREAGPCGQPAPNHQLTITGRDVETKVLPVCDAHFDALRANGMTGEPVQIGG